MMSALTISIQHCTGGSHWALRQEKEENAARKENK